MKPINNKNNESSKNYIMNIMPQNRAVSHSINNKTGKNMFFVENAIIYTTIDKYTNINLLNPTTLEEVYTSIIYNINKITFGEIDIYNYKECHICWFNINFIK